MTAQAKQLAHERNHYYQEAQRLWALCQELRAALGEACTIGEQLAYQLNSQHPRLGELRALYLPLQPDKDQLQWLREQLINAQRMQARAYKLEEQFRNAHADLERQQKKPQ